MGYVGEAKRRYQREWIAKRRDAFFRDKECVLCGAVEALELDHVDPTVKVTHRIWSWSEARRAVELAKRQVLCASCHEHKTSRDRRTVLVHGTYNFYKAGCRCQECTAAYRDSMRLYRSTGSYVTQ